MPGFFMSVISAQCTCVVSQNVDIAVPNVNIATLICVLVIFKIRLNPVSLYYSELHESCAK